MTIEAAKTEKRSFFSVYKPTQGKYTRWGTVAGASIIILTGMYWVYKLFAGETVPQTIAMGVWVLGLTLLTFWFINTPRYAEFLIMTESEMRKVTWPTRSQVINFTKVVILLTLLLGLILWVVDAGFVWFFKWIGILEHHS